MNRIWPVMLKSIVILALWVAVVSLSVRSFFSLVMASHLPLLILLLCGACFVILNIVCFVHLLCLQVWRAFMAAMEKDQTIRKQKILKARYANWVDSKLSKKQLPDIDSPHIFGSCVPSRPAPASPMGTTSQQGASVPGDNSPAVEVTRTKFHGNTKNIRLSLDTPEIYTGERKICKYVMRALKHLIFKKMSYHFITNASGDILHVSKSKAIAEELPDRVVQNDPLVICNDNHYIITFVKNFWFEKFQVTKRSDSKIVNFEQIDLNKFIWPMVWPSTVSLFYAMFEIQHINRHTVYAFIYPAVGVVAWLLTRHNVDDIWKNVLLLMPLRLFFTVSRSLLVCAIAVTWFYPALSIYVTAKILGIIVLSIHVTYAKVRRNVELLGDPVDKYTFNPLLQFWVQVVESCVYCIWGVAWRFSQNVPSPIHHSVLPMIIICQIVGLIWIGVVKRYHVELLRDPVKVFKIAQNRLGESVLNSIEA
ncbi:uncharacterized protein LOC125031113 isoform X2 [Penaeus chinensis]|uniref:uncharacterized protein LOC125031113 isoform X2 n=1 Tax=Penaeus chinensis TaxID=139456 RepID=UPI001FB6474F|nr:uncharacterized protein LOC125031113 isoform X2 [Penaeus chinensis]